MSRFRFQTKCIVFSILFNAGFSSSLIAQQDPLLTHYVIAPIHYNPASEASKKEITCLSVLYHNQWLGLGGEGLSNPAYSGKPPQTQIFNLLHTFDGEDILIENITVLAIRDVIGYQYGNHFLTGTSKIFHFDHSSLSIGMQIGFIDMGIDGNWNPPQTPDDDKLPKKDNDIVFDANFGVIYQNRNYFAGISMSHIPGGKIDWGITGHTFKQHLYFNLGRYIYPNNQNYYLSANALLKSDFTRSQFDFNLTAYYKNMIWSGLTIRDGSSIACLFGFNPGQNTKVGYSIDFNVSKIRPYQNGTHELYFQYCIPHKKRTSTPKIIIWPVRYLGGDKDPRLSR